MHNNDIFKTSLLILAIGLGSVAHAQEKRVNGPKAERAAEMFEKMDLDGNGEVTQSEFVARADARFSDTDANGDGLLSADELAAVSQRTATERANRVVSRLDANDDGQLSKDELRTNRDPNRMFDRIDADSSGGVTIEEFANAREMRRGHRHN